MAAVDKAAHVRPALDIHLRGGILGLPLVVDYQRRGVQVVLFQVKAVLLIKILTAQRGGFVHVH